MFYPSISSFELLSGSCDYWKPAGSSCSAPADAGVDQIGTLALTILAQTRDHLRLEHPSALWLGLHTPFLKPSFGLLQSANTSTAKVPLEGSGARLGVKTSLLIFPLND